MTKSQIFKQAHALAKATIKAGDNYQATFALCLKTIYTEQMTGTPKQIAWAISIKTTKLKDIAKMEADIHAKIAGVELDDDTKAEIDQLFNVINAVKNAKDANFWINHRDYKFGEADNYFDGYCFASSLKAGYVK